MSLSSQTVFENFTGAALSDSKAGENGLPALPAPYGSLDRGFIASLGLCFAAMGCFVASGLPDWQIVASVCGLAAALPPVWNEGRCEANLLTLSRQAAQETGRNAFTAVPAQDVCKPDEQTAQVAAGYAEKLEKLAASELTGAACKVTLVGVGAVVGLGLTNYVMGGVIPRTPQDVRMGLAGVALMTLAVVAGNVLSWTRYKNVANRWRGVQKGTRRLVSYQPK